MHLSIIVCCTGTILKAGRRGTILFGTKESATERRKLLTHRLVEKIKRFIQLKLPPSNSRIHPNKFSP